MSLIIALLFSAAMWGVAPSLGIAVGAAISVLVLLTIMSGKAIDGLLKTDEPFLQFVIGFALLSHVLMVCQIFAPGNNWPIYAYMVFICAASFGSFRIDIRPRPQLIGIAFFAAIFTVIWCGDLSSRLGLFQETGRLQFWIDIIVHAGTIGEFSADQSIGRGMVLMADVRHPLYHIASYMPFAAMARILSLPSLDSAVLIWLPYGILMMATGIAALGYALGGSRLAIAAIAATAFIPAPEQLGLGNGMLGFSWLLETAPGTPYSLAISCGAMAAMIYWMRKPGVGLFAAVCLLTAACFLIRVNTFLWLAPVIALGIVAGAPRLSARMRAVIVAVGLVMLCVLLVVISWRQFGADTAGFLFSYVELVHLGSHPTNYDSLYPWMTSALGRPASAAIGVWLVLLGILGPWLPIFLLFGLPLAAKRRLAVYDAIPFLLLAVACILMMLAPIPQNGDISEFRHRAGPLLVVVISVWSLRFIALCGSLAGVTVSSRTAWTTLCLGGALSIVSLFFNASWSKIPKMDWAKDVYNKQFDVTLFQVAAVLKSSPDQLPRFVVADQSRTARNIDNAAVLTALSGVPTYISCPQSLLLRDDYVGKEASRRMDIADRLSAAQNIDDLRALMTKEHITYYVVTRADQAAFDSLRREAFWSGGSYAIYRGS